MKNSRLTNKERNMVKSAIRRAFSRSDLRKQALEAATVVHTDPCRPRVTKWAICVECNQTVPRYLMEVDHKIPVIPLHLTIEDMSWDDIVNRVWCDLDNLQAICKDPCHKAKSKQEAKQRAVFKKERKQNEGSKSNPKSSETSSEGDPTGTPQSGIHKRTRKTSG